MFKWVKMLLERNDRVEDSLRRKKEVPKPDPPKAMKVSSRKYSYALGYSYNTKTGDFNVWESSD